MKYFKNYFSLVLLFLISSNNLHAQLFGGQVRPKKPVSIVIPATITLAQNRVHYIASINDSDYLPYLPATAAATTATNVNADGIPESTTINIQGTLTTTGVTVVIPVTATGTGTLPAYSNSVNIPAEFTEDGIARDVTLTWASQAYTATTRFINVTIAAVGGTLNAKKLDINTGVGNDSLGILMGTLNYPYNNAGATTTFQIRDIAAIPDRNFGVTSTQGTGAGTSGQFHNFLYLTTVAEDGRVWLNHNLGADYSNLNSPNFNLGQQATSDIDPKAYGSLYQWGRLTDGHELITRTNGTTASAVNSGTLTLSSTDNPGTRLFIGKNDAPFDWRSPKNDNLWQGVTGINNPCPVGFRLPTITEQNTLRTAANITNSFTATNSLLKFTLSGWREGNGAFTNLAIYGNYWSSTINVTDPEYTYFFSGQASTVSHKRVLAMSVRCIQETAPGATLSINCAGKTNTGTLTNGVAASGVSVSIPYTGGNSGWLEGSSATSTGVTGLTATYNGSNNIGTSGNIVFTITGTPVGTGTANFSVNVGGTVCTFSYNVTISIPATITLAQNRVHFIASIYDEDYLPYQAAAAVATTATNVNADGTPEATTINIQGTLTTTGITVQIPVIATGTGTLPAFSTSINVPAGLSEDGVARDITLTWASQAYTTGTTFITATIAAVGGTFNAKKLDINAGIGNDVLGVLIGSLIYPYNNAGATTTYQIRDIAGIPDRNFGVTSTQGTGAGTSGQFHNFLYLPTVAEDGRIWLNHNLGADYTNLNNANFNLGQKPLSITDSKAFGSLYQWGRLSDGHELVNRATNTVVNSNTTTTSSSDAPPSRLFINNTNAATYNDWRSPQNNNLWQGVSGKNNPCPQGFRVPTEVEFTNLFAITSITSKQNAFTNSNLNLTATGYRSNTGALGIPGVLIYWSSTTSTNFSRELFINDVQLFNSDARGVGATIRCIQDPTPTAGLTINCDGKTTTGVLSSGVAASGVSVSIPYTDGNSGWLEGSSATSTGVTGLTATYAGSNNIGTSGNIVFTITGTPVGTGTATFALNIGGQACTATFSVTYPAGTGSFSGKTCFDIALGNDNTNSCGPLSARTPTQSNFTLAATNTQTYTFTPSGTVSNVRFVYENRNGDVITAISGNNTGNNISTAVTATVNFNTDLNTLAAGLTNANPLTADIYVVYNDGATNNGTDRQLKVTPNVKDCACCIVKILATVWKEFMCHNLGADTSLDPNVPVQGIHGNYYQWGRIAPVANASTPSTAISGWDTTTAPDGSWLNISKTANDPCPSGYRVPTNTEWDGVRTNNTVSRTGSWVGNATNFGSAIHWGPDASTKSLTLPAAGVRLGTNGSLNARGSSGYYWSSNEVSSANGNYLNFTTSSTSMSFNGRANASSVRCIAE